MPRLIAIVLLCSSHTVAADDRVATEHRYAERQLYRAAVEHFVHGRLTQFEAAKESLRSYPLYPYLEFRDLHRRLRQLEATEVEAFRARYADSPLAPRLFTAWLRSLPSRGAWQVLLDHYEATSDVELECYYLRALHRSSPDAALDRVAELWRAPHSQPKACDPLFDAWIEAGRLKQGLVWQRLEAAMEAGETGLAQYLTRFLKGRMKADAETFLAVSRHPSQLATVKPSPSASRAATIAAYAIRRLAASDARAASALWEAVAARYTFTEPNARRLRQDLTIARARTGIIDLDADLSPTPDGHHVDVADALLLAGIQNEAWSAVEDWIRVLDEVERIKPKWRYWLGRALRTAAPAESLAEVDEIFGSLARERQYYGFLAATALGIAPVLNERASVPNEVLVAELRSRPVFARIEELFAIDSPIDARREWQAFDATLDLEHKAAAAHLAAQMGWLSQSVMAAYAAELVNDLKLRFPAPFRESFVTAANASTVPLPFLYAIARQESVFDADARSPAGALGVMQLMPGTAAMTARALGVRRPTDAALYDSNLNISLGSHHLATLMARYRNNRILVAAAYNAGAQRVERWRAARAVNPADIWVESIPFLETRNYVKNVLAFAYVYGQMLDRPAPFLTDHEL